MEQMLRVRPDVLLWPLALAVLAACSQPMTGGETVAEPVPAPEVKATDVDEDSEVKVDFGVLEGPIYVPDLCRYGVGDPLLSVEPCPPKAKDEHEGLSAFEAANRELEAEEAREAKRKARSEVERARAKPWESLPPARVSQSADHCIGYCFDAVLGAVDEANRRFNQVVVFDKRGRPTRALVERTRMRGWGREVRYTCFDRAMDGEVPRFADCRKTPRGDAAPTVVKAPADEGPDWGDAPPGDAPFID